MLVNIILLVIGFVILIKGANYFVTGSSSIATNFKVPKMVIGLTIVALGTSAPEFAVSVKSLISGNGDILIGNVIGSNILNILLILGVSSMYHVLNVKNNTVKKEIPIVLFISILFVVLLSDNLFDKGNINSFTRSDGIVLVLFFMVFIYYLVYIIKNKFDYTYEKVKMSLTKSFVLTFIGVVGIILGSNFVVDSASSLARLLGISERMIALTIIAFGTTLPELVTSVTATRKGEYDIAIGNVIGSNISNIGIVIGLPVAILGGVSSITFSIIDLIFFVLSILLLFVFSYNDYKISKKEGICFLILFVVYYSYVIIGM